MSSLAAALADTLQRRLPASAEADLQLLTPLIEALFAALEQGELGLDLKAEAPDGLDQSHWPDHYLTALKASGWLVQADALRANTEVEALIVQEGRWLRWRRWQEQLSLCLDQLIHRAQAPLPQTHTSAAIHRAIAAASAGLDGTQQEAVAALLQHPLVVLLGGPGTGKTSTVARMLAAALALEPQLRVQLAAPTGKAAARLSAALAKRPSLPCSTLHRLLEARGGSRFARQAANPLELDLLVVDELSMVDLPLMAALLEAMPPQGRLLLVGDAGQLPPVGTGAVLEELCRPAVRAQLGSAVVELTTTYRNNGAIAAIAAAARDQPTRSADPLQGLRPLLHGLEANANLRWLECPLQQLPKAVLTPLRQHQQQLQELSLALQWHGSDGEPGGAAALLAELEQLIALSPVRQGPWGVQALHRALLGPAATGPLERWPLGTPVLNRLNRPEQELANGDIGVLVEREGQRLVLMAGGRLLHPARLAGAEPALALTVHKAQGSQYGQVLLLVPPSRHADPRLLYTGLTRARQQLLLVSPSQAA